MVATNSSNIMPAITAGFAKEKTATGLALAAITKKINFLHYFAPPLISDWCNFINFAIAFAYSACFARDCLNIALSNLLIKPKTSWADNSFSAFILNPLSWDT
jgi:hypothetical protein